MAITYKKCPKCGSKNSVNIVYGFPSYELFQKAEAGKVKLGGCVVENVYEQVEGSFILNGNPEYYCKDCKHEWNRGQSVDEAYSKINTIKASVGGYFGGYYEVTIDLKNHETTWRFNEGAAEETSKKSIRVSTAQAFLEELKVLNLLNWKAKYIETGVCDGTQWNVEILTDGKIIKKYGDNKYPKEWDLFCRLIRQITKRKFQ